MGLFDKKQPKPPEPTEPPKRKWVYFVLTEDDYLEGIEADCKRIGLYYEIEEQKNGEVWIYFYEEDKERAHDVMNTPRKKPEQKKASLDNQVGSAYTRTQIPDNAFTRATAAAEAAMKKPSVLGQLKQPVTPPPPAPPTEIENRWAEEKLAEELQEIEQEIKEADALVASSQEPAAEAAGKQRKKRKSLGRTNQIMTRLTDAELVQFQRRVKKSGLAQGDFLRSAALNGQIVIEERSMADLALLDELALIRRDLGKQGGLLKMIIKPNEGQRELAPEEWAELIAAVRDLEKMKKRLSDLEVKVQHGNREAQDK